jgi:uncharacterized phiE125 gp8 family phage protein
VALTRITDPAIEPVSVEEVKGQLNLDADLTADDALLGMLITGAREYAEAYCNRSFNTQVWRMERDTFSDAMVCFERAPVVSVDSIKYLDMGRNWQTITQPGTVGQTTTDGYDRKFALALDGAVARMSPAFGYIWPITLPQIGAVQITYTAGYGDKPENVPTGIRNWIKMRVATQYQNREEVAITSRGKIDALPYVDRLLDPWVVRLA